MDRTMRFWDVGSGECEKTIGIAFSKVLRILKSSLDSDFIRQMSSGTGLLLRIQKTFEFKCVQKCRKRTSAKVCLPPNNAFYYTFSTHFVWLSGPDITAKLCLAPNNTLLGVAVSGGENKVSLIPLPVVCVATVLLLCF
jgi:hypothetical protein